MRIAAILALVMGVPASAQMVVTSAAGKVEGSMAASGVRQFLGVPYAAAPVGNLRWREPQALAAWKGVRPAKAFGHHCVQFGVNADMVFPDAGESEDCLNLNVWTPEGAKPRSLPVMVWIYGGGFTTGASSEPRQNAQFLAKRGVVVVSMNYRLGMLGFMTSPELTAESAHHASGNYGLMDQAAAIAWVKRNIAAFGGDPNNITIFGESAGSFSVSAQMASPMTKGLIAKAIGESGAGFWSQSIPFDSLANREKHDAELAKKGIGTASLAELRKIQAAVLAKVEAFRDSKPFPPDIDGYFLPDKLVDLYARGEEAHIPLLAGWNADEIRLSVTHAKIRPTAADFIAAARNSFGDKADAFLQVYPAKTDAEALQSKGDYVSDRFISFSTWRWLEANVATNSAPTFRYRWDFVPPGDKFHPAGAGAFHSDDIEYVFGTLDSRQQAVWRKEDRVLSDEVQRYWVNFARTGNPNGDGLPQWPQYKAGEWMVMHLDQPSVAKKDDLRERYLVLDSIWMK